MKQQYGIWTEGKGWRPYRDFKSQQILVKFFFPWRLPKDLATFGITKYYRWLTVAPLGDGAFLKASRIQT